MNITEELDKLEKSLDENTGPIVTKFASIIREALMSMRALAGENPKSQELIIKIAGDLKKLSAMIKRDLKKKK